ncbi:MAG: hypothetical protein ACYTER_09795, partial [Planctomycetota bacterium]
MVGTTGMQIIGNMINPNKKAFATYDGGKMNNLDIQAAQNELQVLRMLSGDQLLAVQGTGGALLCDLIFPDSQMVGDLPAQLKQAVQRGQIELDISELEAYFNQQPENPAILWHLLKAEARRGGYLVSTANAQNVLKAIAPQMTQGQGSAVQLVGAVMQKSGLTEAQIIRIFGELLTVSDYANRVMNNQAVTLNQVKASLGRSKERLDAEYVTINAEALIDEDAAISDAEIAEAYKQNDAGIVTADNPYGFGYKLPKRVQLEYMIVLANDVKEIIEAPTNTEMDRYYRMNIAQFQTEEPSDPNDPESEKITKTKSFTEVERQIRSSIKREKTSTMTSMIINKMKDTTEKRFVEVTFEEATNAQLQEVAGEYDLAAKEIAETHGVTVTTGKTGWLSAADFQNEKILRSLNRQQGRTRLRLSELAFVASTDPKQQRRIGLPAVRVWENIGPVAGAYSGDNYNEYHLMTALVRVVAIEEAAVAADINVEYDTKGVALFETEEDKEKASFSVKEAVTEDLRLKKAMDVANAR